MRRVIFGVVVGLISLGSSHELREEWRAEVYQIEREIEGHKGRYTRAMERSDRFRDEASWTHFSDHARYRSLMGRSAREREYAEESRQAAEDLIEERDGLLKERGLPRGNRDTPWR